MSTRDNSISLAVQMTYDLLVGFKPAEEDEIWQIVSERLALAFVSAQGTVETLTIHFSFNRNVSAEPKILAAMLIGTACLGAGLPINELVRLVYARRRH